MVAVADTGVWYSYEFTLLSNTDNAVLFVIFVWYSYEFTLLSNQRLAWSAPSIVWYSYEFTLLSKHWMNWIKLICVWYSYEFTLLSNGKGIAAALASFDIPMNLHYSQTIHFFRQVNRRFDIPMNLHYSQTLALYAPHEPRLIFLWIYTTLKHGWSFSSRSRVWYSYKFTLLSNTDYHWRYSLCVWYSYEFTLLSNLLHVLPVQRCVWYSYEFTLLSNLFWHSVQYTLVWYSYEFTLLSNVTTDEEEFGEFDIPMNLHYSQTIILAFFMFQ